MAHLPVIKAVRGSVVLICLLCAQTLGQMALELAVAEAADAQEDGAPAAAMEEGPAASNSGWEQIEPAPLLNAEAADAAGVLLSGLHQP
jgi:hypothetical protein